MSTLKTSRPNRARHLCGCLTLGVFFMLSACGEQSPSVEVSAPATDSGDSATPAAPATETPTASPSSTTVPETSANFSGTYAMVEFYDDDDGVFSAMTHELVIADAVSGRYEGTLTQVAFDQDGIRSSSTVPVVGEQRGDSLEIVSVDSESAEVYPLGTVLFRLTGTPDDPATELGRLVTLMPADRGASLSFLPGSAPAPGDFGVEDRVDG